MVIVSKALLISSAVVNVRSVGFFLVEACCDGVVFVE